ncbi:MAG: hypothetical protein SV375_17695 [Thermodesulfobacteriota bacterium]|nr:hypothetical protein [Thermodesulfobacteriota bacterium]
MSSEKRDDKILGIGPFVEDILGESNEIYEIRMRAPIDELIRKVATNVDIDMNYLKS